MTKIKICGVTTIKNALMTAEAGADMLGLNFYRPSPRHINPETARKIRDALRAQLGATCPVLVGVFVNESPKSIATILDIAGLDFAQLSGNEPYSAFTTLKDRAFKGIRPASETSAQDDVRRYRPGFLNDECAPSILLDAYHPQLYGGTGEEASIEVALAVKAAVPRLMLAGGLTPENIAARVEAIQPWGVDVASGVERDGQPGVKDPAKVKAFIDAVRSTDSDYEF